uniref:FAD-dependent oxidoreductase n=1 Tax=Caulobacter sp. S45 TaxID=1641861 RepID=UPI0015753AC8
MVDSDVLVIGAGPVGLSLAVELGLRGLRVLVAERNERVGHAPRAKTTYVRTRTFFRRWGLADKLAEASPLGVNYPYDVHFVTRLAGHGLARIQNGFNAAPLREDAFPEHAQWIPQYKLEAVLRERVSTLPSVDLRFNLAFHGAEDDGESVTSTLRDALGDKQVVRSRFLVGADGA